MRLPLRELERGNALVVLETALEPSDVPMRMRYRTRTGALLRLDGAVAGAFDREHTEVLVSPSAAERRVTLEVERRALPTNHLPSGDGWRWQLMLRRATQEPAHTIDVEPVAPATVAEPATDVALWGHSHLDVAWLWNYTETRRKAMRTFANALAVGEADPSFVFMQSQPQLYAYVEEQDAAFFARVVDAVREGRFDPSPAALWVEPDCNLISGESLLRQMLFAHRYCTSRFDRAPVLAWLPDTFGFPNTLPTLLAHADIPYFASTKLQWNDTTRFAHPQFRWRGPDGSEVLGAMLAAYEGSASSKRVATARERHEPLVIGYSDGGGGPTLAQVREAERIGSWQRPPQFFETLRERADVLPVHDDELYLEYHRGTYTTHHDVKAANARIERMLRDVEERVAWCVAVRAPRDVVERLHAQIDAVWEIALRNQFHDVLPGTSVPSAYEESLAEYERAFAMLEFVRSSTEAMLPRAARSQRVPAPCRPVFDDGEYVFDNGIVHARVNENGALVHCSGPGAPNVIAQANLLAAYRDRPRKWEAWNVDAGYERHPARVRPVDRSATSDGLTVRFDAAGSPLTMQVSLIENEPFLRVDVAADWRSDRVLLRVENWLTVAPDRVRFGSPHGTVARAIDSETPAGRARFEVPGQRFASAAEAERGMAIFTLDTYGWSTRRLSRGGTHIGHSLLRAPRWPDPLADRGDVALSWAFAPHGGAGTGALEHAWESYAMPPRVRLFTATDTSVLVVAVKPAVDGNGVIVRVRECDGEARPLRLRCGARMRGVCAVDALERTVEDEAAIEGEELVATIPGFGLRSYRVTF
ncbi:MAG TPA: glycoside hydrolase family 38 C-terminal domain-containing protein [Candidatus Aquilonibacter sp.]|nr:glycoside hydrolase family 38 C-terminal domain-containing protein [Candidatus Aquilonibacter sp.]